MGFLTKFIPGGWILWLIIGVAAFGAGFAAKRFLDAPTFAGLVTACQASGFKDNCAPADIQAAQDAAKLDAAHARTALAEQQKVIALDLAQAAEKARATERALQGQVSDLTAKLAATDKARQAASLKLLDTLKAIPHEQQATLSAGVTDYLRRVHDAQTSGANPTPAPDRRPDPIPVPGRITGPTPTLLHLGAHSP